MSGGIGSDEKKAPDGQPASLRDVAAPFGGPPIASETPPVRAADRRISFTAWGLAALAGVAIWVVIFRLF